LAGVEISIWTWFDLQDGGTLAHGKQRARNLGSGTFQYGGVRHFDWWKQDLTKE
jgi:hypothetical protein